MYLSVRITTTFAGLNKDYGSILVTHYTNGCQKSLAKENLLHSLRSTML